MKSIIPGLIIMSLVFTACSSNEKEAEKKEKDKYEQTKETLEQTEKKNPKRFLTEEGNDRKNLDIELSFYSETGALLLRDHEVIYKVIAPGSSQSFKTKILAPKGTDSVAMKIVAAKVE